MSVGIGLGEFGGLGGWDRAVTVHGWHAAMMVVRTENLLRAVVLDLNLAR